MEKIVPVASQQQGTAVVCKPEDGFIRGITRENLAQERDLVTQLLEQVAQVVWHVLVQEEFHSEGAI